jgi:L-lactate dehydrogenase
MKRRVGIIGTGWVGASVAWASIPTPFTRRSWENMEDSSVVLWSSASVGGVAVRDWPGWDRQSESRVAEEMRRVAYEIIRRKGATIHAIGLVTVDLLQSMLRSERRILTVSRVQDGALGMRDLALSLPAIVSAAGASMVVEPQLSADERSSLDHSAKVLREAAAALDA